MIEADRIISATAKLDEDVIDRAIRPKLLADYVGQPQVCEQMEIFIKAAQLRQDALDHLLIFGPPGLGKTTLANIVANEMGVNIRTTSGPVLEKAGDLAAMLTNLEPHDVLFIDEIHRLSPAIEEVLYPAMEDYQLDIMIGEGPAARSIKLDLPPFTLIGATTRAGSLTSPLRDRFGIVQRLEFYSVPDLTSIVSRSAVCLQLKIDDSAAYEIARRSRGTPRIANRLLRRVRDYADVRNNGEITETIAKAALSMLDIDDAGFDYLDRKLLTAVLERFDGGPVGLDNLAAAIGEERDTIEDVLEQIVGDIEDEFDEEDVADIRQLSRHAYAVRALTDIEDFNQQFNTQFNDEEVDTVGGLIMQAFGYLPKRGEEITLENLHFKVTSADSRRIIQLRVTVPDEYLPEMENVENVVE